MSFWIVASGNAPKSIAVGVCPVQAKTLQVGEASVAKILADKDVRKLLGTVIFNADEGRINPNGIEIRLGKHVSLSIHR